MPVLCYHSCSGLHQHLHLHIGQRWGDCNYRDLLGRVQGEYFREQWTLFLDRLIK